MRIWAGTANVPWEAPLMVTERLPEPSGATTMLSFAVVPPMTSMSPCTSTALIVIVFCTVALVAPSLSVTVTCTVYVPDAE
jgi:hypothetical protein